MKLYFSFFFFFIYEKIVWLKYVSRTFIINVKEFK